MENRKVEDSLTIQKKGGLAFYDLKAITPDQALVGGIPESYARLHRMIILKKEAGQVTVGMSHPTDAVALDALHKLIQDPITLVRVDDEALERVFNLLYRRTQVIRRFAKELSSEIATLAPTTHSAHVERLDAPAKKLIDALFSDAAQMHASDIHIEPAEKHIRFRLRIDGVLHDQSVPDITIMPAVVSRLKLLAGLDIAEKRLPQDGRFDIIVSTSKERFDVRLSTMPTMYGESIVMRLLKQSDASITLESAGMSPDVLSRYRSLCQKSNGVILVTGPTGSGKTTTLYATLRELNRPEIKIVTIEDPIEYFLPNAVQIQINEEIGLPFATILRSILRHDPDLVLIGEMRDKETVSMVMRMALTGRLLFSTVHTNDAIHTIYRLIELGAESFVLAAVLRAVLAQRLVRLICQECSETTVLSQQEKIWLSKLGLNTKNLTVKHGKGCVYCNNTGYHGRTMIVEMLTLDADMSDALRVNDMRRFHQLAQTSMEKQFLLNDAYRLVYEGKTTVAEIMRVVSESDVDNSFLDK